MAILDADKQGFLRSATALIQTIGRAARNVSGEVHMYGDSITPAMAQAIEETNRRRAKQVTYNTEHGIDPTPLRKKISDITDLITKEAQDTEELGLKIPSTGLSGVKHSLPRQELIGLIESLTEQMKLSAADLQFELAARFRDEIRELKKELRGMEEAGT